MLTPQQVEQCIQTISRLGREEVIAQFRRCDVPFPVDFTDEWLQIQSLEDLRHVYAALCIQCEVMPEEPAAPTGLAPVRAA